MTYYNHCFDHHVFDFIHNGEWFDEHVWSYIDSQYTWNYRNTSGEWL